MMSVSPDAGAVPHAPGALAKPAAPIAPTPARMLPLLVIVPVVAMAMRLGRPHYLETQASAIVFAALCAGVLGWPALFWAIDHARTRLRSLVTLGVIAGLMAPLAVLLAGVLGQLQYAQQYGGLRYLRRMLEHGATMPSYGMVPWIQFAGLAAASAIAGAVSAVVYWLLVVHRRPSVGVAFALSIAVIGAGAALAMLLP